MERKNVDDKERRSVQLNLRVTPEEKARASALAKRERRSITSMLMFLVEKASAKG